MGDDGACGQPNLCGGAKDVTQERPTVEVLIICPEPLCVCVLFFRGFLWGGHTHTRNPAHATFKFQYQLTRLN